MNKKYDNPIFFRNNFAEVSLNGKYGIINKEKEEVCKLKYDYINFNFKEDFAIARLKDKCGFITMQGIPICEFKYEWVDHFQNNIAMIRLNGKYGFIDTNGNEICELKYDWISRYYEKEGFCRALLNNENTYLNLNANEITQENVLSLICHREDEQNWYFFKFLRNDLKSPYRNFRYELNREYDFSDGFDDDPSNEYGAGFNVATLEWCLEEKTKGEKIFLCRVPKNQKFVIPFYFEGKLRFEKGTILPKEEVAV